MYIKKAQIDNFGKFYKKTIHFSPGLNVVYGENESGKSTLHHFLTGMLFGMERQRGRNSKGDIYQRYEPWNTASYYAGSMEFVVADKEFVLQRNFYHKERSAKLHNPKDGEELSVEHGDLQVLLGGVNRRFYENTCCIAQAAVVTEEGFGLELQSELVNRIYGGESGVDVGKARKTLENRRKQQEQRLKKCQQEKRERQERLEWEQELLQRDIVQLQQKMLAEKRKAGISTGDIEGTQNAKTTDVFLQTMSGTSEEVSADKKNETAPDSFWFHIPLLGWLLKLIWRIFHPNKEKTAATEENSNDLSGEDEVSQSVMAESERFVMSGTIEILSEQLEEKQTYLSNIQEEMEELRGISGNQREIEIELKSIQLAEEVLEHVAKEGYQDSRDDMQAAVSGIFSEITGGKYDHLEITEAGQVLLYEENKPLKPWQLSRGAMEQLYFALRLGAGRCMLQEEPMPVLLDETFCAYDEQRLKQTLQWLSEQKEQVILFTCQKRELSLLENMGIEYRRILL